MNFKVLFVGAVAALSLAACQKSDNNTSSLPAPQLADGTAYVKGTPAYSYTGSGHAMTVDGAAVTDMNDKAWEGYGGLSNQAGFLAGIDGAVETTDHVLELSSGGNLVLAIDMKGETPAVLWASNDFKAERIAYVREGAEQGGSVASATFDLKECVAAEQTPAQEQQQGKGEAQEQNQEIVKGEPAVEQGQAEQGKVEQSKEQVKGEEQAKDETPEEKVEPATCRMATVVLNFTQIQEKQEEQQQGKVEQDQTQEQGKEQVKGEEQSKDEGKAAEQTKG